MNPSDLKYSKEHEWVRIEPGGAALIGITAFAAEQLGDVVYLDLPSVGTELKQFGKLGEVESVKAVSEVYAPISGRVIGRNEEAIAHPELVNSEPYGRGWFLRVAVKERGELDNLLSAQEYEEFLAAEV
ncbi:MAG: glycine cleavage system protein GcvH [Chloroflexi bacterium]|nr:glycine cleavage system protein GcvH [Chloroflexota bacterium]